MSATCTVSIGDNPLAISWSFNDQKITDTTNPDILISTSKRRSLLEIEAVGHHHAGTYTCYVTNEAGTDNHSAVLIVNGKNLVF